jgi:hypothetical protein
MAIAAANLADVRGEVIRRLYVVRDVILDTASGGDTSSIISVGGTDTVHLESAVYTSLDYVSSWVYVPGVAAPQQSRVTAYDRDAGDLTISPVIGASASSEAYEIHYLLPPTRLNDWIKIRAREGSSGAMTTIAEGTAINIDKFTLAEGVLADALKFLAKRESGEIRTLFEQEADHHELLWLRRLALRGLRPLVVRLNIQREDTEEAQVLRRF